MRKRFVEADNHEITRFTFLRQAVVLAAAASAEYAGKSTAATAAPAALTPHPRLLLNAAGIAALKNRIAGQPWAKTSWEKLKSDATSLLSQPVELPPRGGNWSHHYVCPEHGARLTRGKKVGPWQWEHRCPVGPHVLRGSPAKASLDFDGNAISGVHSDYARQIVDNGLVYQITGDERYAGKGRAVLLAYAEKYRTYPLHDNNGKPGKGGRVASQSLTEASWIIEICQGADLIWTSLSETEQVRVREGILMPALNEIILPSRLGIHNIQCRLNSAIGLAGFLIGDEALISRAIEDKELGLLQQMEKGVLADGMWREGSSGYHFFTIDGVWPLMEAARNCGRDLYAAAPGAKFKAMFDAPFTFAMPNLVLPDFNDSNEVPLDNRADSYELAYARYGDPLYTPLVRKGARHGRLALLFGMPQLSKEAEKSLGSRNSPASGYAILQSGRGEQAAWVCVKYGPHGGGHGHPDKNHFTLYAKGQVLAPDGGTHAYGSPLHDGWDKATAAHNTLVVDEKSQTPSEGKSLAFGSVSGVEYSITDAGAIYEGVRFVRTAALIGPNLLVLFDQVSIESGGDAPRTLDLVYHHVGVWDALPPGDTWTVPKSPGYQFLTKVTSRSLSETPLTLGIKEQNGKTAAAVIIAGGGQPTEIVTGYGIRKSTDDLVPMLVMRRHAQNTAFLWAVSLDTGVPVKLTLLAVKDAASGVALSTEVAALVQVEAAAGKQTHLLVNPDKKSVAASAPSLAGEWKTSAPFAVR